MVRKINFITNQDLGVTSGGWSGINWNIHRQLNAYFDINYVGPIQPKMNTIEKVSARLLREIGMKSKFNFFSDKRLQTIKNSVESNLKKADYNFFFGQTPWIDCKSEIPYGVYLDADFKTYLNIFSTPEKFSSMDIDRIAKKEELWLQGANDIFVGSEWAWREMTKHYNLNYAQKIVVHTGGNIDLPEIESYDGGFNLVFISLNFEKKGGFICVKAFELAKQKFPKLTLTIIGEKPPEDILAIEGITYAGLLRKTVAEDVAKFKNIMAKAFLLIHPTKMDTMGAVLIEAGYFGCPSIAPNSFGVPELVLNDKTGFIVEVPFTSRDFSSKIEYLIKKKQKYLMMRKNAWHHTRSNLTWTSIGLKLKERLLNK